MSRIVTIRHTATPLEVAGGQLPNPNAPESYFQWARKEACERGGFREIIRFQIRWAMAYQAAFARDPQQLTQQYEDYLAGILDPRD